ncbi:hydrolase [Pectobacterium versatile]|uniref:hydrolase n=1 Tax=Pectobacterium versatile TaxID=2488639 RepID=UPI0019691481|nr:hydrolase [Pectobacterium versatile]MBN3239838.1 hydrolase [Pectobacterium versatile]
MSHTDHDKDSLINKVRICYHNRWITFFTIIFSSLVTIIFWIFFFHTSLAAEFSTYMGIHDGYFLQHPHAKMDKATLQKIGELVSKGTLLSLDDLWSFQGTFYQTIITVLIALNAILGGFAFFMIKQSSNAKAREEATEEVKRYIESKSFDKEVKDITNTKVELIVNEKIGALQIDLASQIDFISTLAVEIESIKSKNDRITQLDNEFLEIKRHIALLASAVSQLDKSEDDGASLTLK